MCASNIPRCTMHGANVRAAPNVSRDTKWVKGHQMSQGTPNESRDTKCVKGLLKVMCQGTPIVSRDTKWVKGHQTCQGTPKGKIFTKDTDQMDQGYQSVSNASSVEQDEQFKRLFQLCFKWLNLGRVEAKKEANYLLFRFPFVFILGRTKKKGRRRLPGVWDKKKQLPKRRSGFAALRSPPRPKSHFYLFSFP